MPTERERRPNERRLGLYISGYSSSSSSESDMSSAEFRTCVLPITYAAFGDTRDDSTEGVGICSSGGSGGIDPFMVR